MSTDNTEYVKIRLVEITNSHCCPTCGETNFSILTDDDYRLLCESCKTTIQINFLTGALQAFTTKIVRQLDKSLLVELVDHVAEKLPEETIQYLCKSYIEHKRFEIDDNINDFISKVTATFRGVKVP